MVCCDATMYWSRIGYPCNAVEKKQIHRSKCQTRTGSCRIQSTHQYPSQHLVFWTHSASQEGDNGCRCNSREIWPRICAWKGLGKPEDSQGGFHKSQLNGGRGQVPAQGPSSNLRPPETCSPDGRGTTSFQGTGIATHSLRLRQSSQGLLTLQENIFSQLDYQAEDACALLNFRLAQACN